MRLLLDAHHSPVVADRLRAEGYDVLAAVRDVALNSLPDQDLLRAATDDGRALVTEDVGDFDLIARHRSTTGQHHAGIVMTPPGRHHRASKAYPGNLVAALRDLLDTAPESTPDRIFWLP